MNRILEIIKWKDLIRNLVLKNLRIRYKGSVLGFLWTMINPMFMMLIYFIFLRLLRIAIDLPSLLVGILAWQYFVMCLSDSVNAITAHPSLIKRTSFPRLVFPLSMVLANLINFLLSLIVLVLFLSGYSLFFGYTITLGLPLILLPGVIILQTALVLGFGSFFACCNVYFKDTEHIMSILLLAWFFLTPIMYPLEKVRESAGQFFNLYLLNPMVPVVTLYRWVFLGIAPPTSPLFYLSCLLPFLILFAGVTFFLKKELYFADEM
ncbi:MAG: ABC transporter permease [Candidatus Erginobacter occultus]|nr:ABC transporter permease [Candidatus Erginobacter occultus]